MQSDIPANLKRLAQFLQTGFFQRPSVLQRALHFNCLLRPMSSNFQFLEGTCLELCNLSCATISHCVNIHKYGFQLTFYRPVTTGQIIWTGFFFFYSSQMYSPCGWVLAPTSSLFSVFGIKKKKIHEKLFESKDLSVNYIFCSFPRPPLPCRNVSFPLLAWHTTAYLC